MKSLSYIPASDGSGDASLMTITQVRTAPATTITVNTVAGAPTNFFATMGTPHTFNDPVTGETITVISEATAVNFAGRIDSGKVEIVAIAPGETDLGSKVGDIIIIRPTTQWADNIHDILSESLNDDGSLKNKAATLAKINGGTTAGVLTTDASGNVTSSILGIRNDSSNLSSLVGLKIFSGWGQFLGNGTSTQNVSVSFPSAFTTTPYMVIVKLNGYKSSGTLTTLKDVNTGIGPQFEASTSAITNSGFTANFNSTASFGAAYHAFSWIAIGI